MTFTGTVWLWPGENPWHFVSLPPALADDLEARAAEQITRFGMIPVEVRSGGATWETSVVPDKESATYLLPLKKAIRARLGCTEGSAVPIELRARSTRPRT